MRVLHVRKSQMHKKDGWRNHVVIYITRWVGLLLFNVPLYLWGLVHEVLWPRSCHSFCVSPSLRNRVHFIYVLSHALVPMSMTVLVSVRMAFGYHGLHLANAGPGVWQWTGLWTNLHMHKYTYYIADNLCWTKILPMRTGGEISKNFLQVKSSSYKVILI